jgi:predicted dehydrogenase
MTQSPLLSSAEMTGTAPRKVLIVGYGSIGMRHARVLQGLGLSVSVVSRRGDVSPEFVNFRTVAEAVAKVRPDYAVVATETAVHTESLRALADAGCSAPVLVEKPLFAQVGTQETNSNPNLYVGYQFRFHPAISRLRQLVAGSSNIAAQFYVGQHVDGWRPGRTARESYSGYAASGGGVLRDLSHELDLALWLFGRCERVAALGGRFAEVTSDSDDAWGILARFERCPIVTFQLNYLDRISQRRIVVVTDQSTVSVDLVAGVINVDGTTSSIACDGDAAFVGMHQAIIESNGRNACDFHSAMRVVELVDSVERAARAGTWIEL